MSTKPWQDKWETGDRIGAGGQGYAYSVTAKQGATPGVAKLLRKPDDIEARRRMFREVNNLKSLEGVTASKIPRVLDDNLECFEQVGIPLYFVMEHIHGDSLAALVQREGKLHVDCSVALTLDVCDTFMKAMANEVHHRDLKPENVILRSLNPIDVVIVDYGLSFNTGDESGVTRANENFDNDFMSLPERRVPNGDRRDPRSDLVGICGILFFCLTGEHPVDLSDANGHPPHRRGGRSMKTMLAGYPRAAQIDVF